MIIVISPEKKLSKEIVWVNKLFDSGLMCYHLRKPSLKDSEVATYLKEIKEDYHSKIVLHDRENLVAEFGLRRMHYSEAKRVNTGISKKEGCVYSTSVHDITAFNNLNAIFQYAFISPVYPSISKKDYRLDCSVIDQMETRLNFKTKLIGLGGITPQNMQEVLAKGADGVALLGAIWQSENPLETFKLCKK